MRRTVLLLGILLLVLLFAPTAGAAAPSGPRSYAVDPTAVEPLTPINVVAGTPTALTATLRDTATNETVGGAVLVFSEKTTFGWLRLGNKTTDARGEASIFFEAVTNGTYTIRIAYYGNASYAASNASVTLSAFASSSAPPPPVPADRLIVFVILAVVGGVWATYAFVGLQILGIRSIGSRPEDETFESRELEKMATSEREPVDAEASKKRVPGISNANRAVVYLAISALVLSGAAIGLLLMGGVGHTAAYTPTTVEFSITAVPDLRGGGYDSFVPNQLVVHAGDSVKITLYSTDADMAHGFAIDALGIKIGIPAATVDNATGDIIPAIVTVPTFTVASVGVLTFYCTAYCGDGHATMTGTLVVLPD